MKGKGFSSQLWGLVAIVIIALLISIGIFFLMDNPGTSNNETTILKPGTVVADYNNYIGKNITVTGYFYEFDTRDRFGYIHSKEINEPIKQGDIEQESDFLLINYASVTNISSSVQKYNFHGTLQEANFSKYDIDLVYLNVTSLELV